MTPHVSEGHIVGGHEQLTYVLQGDVQKGLGRTGGPGTEIYNKLQISYEDRYQPVRQGPPSVSKQWTVCSNVANSAAMLVG